MNLRCQPACFPSFFFQASFPSACPVFAHLRVSRLGREDLGCDRERAVVRSLRPSPLSSVFFLAWLNGPNLGAIIFCRCRTVTATPSASLHPARTDVACRRRKLLPPFLAALASSPSSLSLCGALLLFSLGDALRYFFVGGGEKTFCCCCCYCCDRSLRFSLQQISLRVSECASLYRYCVNRCP